MGFVKVYKSSRELSANSILLKTKRDFDKAQRWLDSGRQIFVVGRNALGIILNFYPKDKVKKIQNTMEND